MDLGAHCCGSLLVVMPGVKHSGVAILGVKPITEVCNIRLALPGVVWAKRMEILT